MATKSLRIHGDIATLLNIVDSKTRNVFKASIGGHSKRFYDTARSIFTRNGNFNYKSICYGIADTIHLSVDDGTLLCPSSDTKPITTGGA